MYIFEWCFLCIFHKNTAKAKIPLLLGSGRGKFSEDRNTAEILCGSIGGIFSAGIQDRGLGGAENFFRGKGNQFCFGY